ncbi:MAG TPA: helix-turn-helix domain-containing protein [Parvularculaceae bacterium]|nr:helix-turn-helix domain-containing protein [Parvularculaceae bacterium]
MPEQERHNNTPVYARAAQVRPLLDMAAAGGVDIAELLKALGISPGVFENDGKIALADYFRLQNQVSAALSDETLHLSSRQLLPGTTDFVMARLSAARSLHDAMKTLAQSFNLLHGGEYNFVRRKGDVIAFTIDDRGFPYTQSVSPEFLHFSLECVQIFLHCMIALVSRPHAQAGLRRLAVTRAERSPQSIHLDFWRAPVRFGANAYSLAYDYDVATAAIEPPPAETLNAAAVYQEIVSAAASPRATGQAGAMSDFVRQALTRGIIDQTRIAALAGISVATLRRRLECEGSSFRDLRRDVLNIAAKRLLQHRNSVAQVAEELGFSDFRAFNRAFKAWNGVTPKAFADRPTPKAD